MDRLTYKDAAGDWVIACNQLWHWFENKYPAHIKGAAIDRLAAYEDKGVEPGDMLDAIEMAKVACKLQKLKSYEDAEERGERTATPDKGEFRVQYVPGDIVEDIFGDVWKIAIVELHLCNDEIIALYRVIREQDNIHQALYANNCHHTLEDADICMRRE